MSRAHRQQADWVDGADRLHVAEQYAGWPRDGLVVRVEQRTTLAGRAVLLTPAQVTELHAWLGRWLSAIPASTPRTPPPTARENPVTILCPGGLAARYAWDSPVLDEDGSDPYCTVCGEWAGLFAGPEGWQHFRGDPAPGGQRRLHDAGHKPVIGWMRPPGLPLSSAGLDTLALMLGDALAYRQLRQACCHCDASSSRLCEGCADDRERAGSFRAVAAALGITGDGTR